MFSFQAHSAVASLEADPETLLGLEDEESDEEYRRLNRALSSLLGETSRLRTQAESQRERLMRMRMIESQLTKAKRELTDLRSQMNTAVAAAVVTAESVGVQAIPVSVILTVYWRFEAKLLLS